MGGGINYRGIIESKNPPKLIEYLAVNEVAAIIPIEKNELLCAEELVPNAYNLTQRLVSIPLYPSLTDYEQDYIIDKLLKYADKEGDYDNVSTSTSLFTMVGLF